MTITQFPGLLNRHGTNGSRLTSRDRRLVDLLQVLTSTTTQLGTELEIGELADIGGAIDRLRSEVLMTSEETPEGFSARERCQRLIEAAACSFIEALRHTNETANIRNTTDI